MLHISAKHISISNKPFRLQMNARLGNKMKKKLSFDIRSSFNSFNVFSRFNYLIYILIDIYCRFTKILGPDRFTRLVSKNNFLLHIGFILDRTQTFIHSITHLINVPTKQLFKSFDCMDLKPKILYHLMVELIESLTVLIEDWYNAIFASAQIEVIKHILNI